MTAVIIYGVIAIAIFITGYFVGSNNPSSAVKAKIKAEINAAANGVATSVTNAAKKI